MAKFRSGDVVAITGASSGIGLSTALAFASAGARLVLIARNAAKLEELAVRCREIGAETWVATADVTDYGALERIAAVVVERFGRLDVWVNNAGVGAIGTFTDVPRDVHVRVIETNLFGYLNGAYAAMKIFGAAKRGTVINVASISSYIAQPTSLAYVTSKFAIRGFVYSLRQDVALAKLRDVDVCLVHPQVVDTDVFTHMANYGGTTVDLKLPTVSPERVARAIVSVAKRPRRETYVGLFGRFGSFGHRILPGVAERMMMRLARMYYSGRPRTVDAHAGNVFAPPK